MSQVFKFRHQIYCVERGFLRVEDYPDGLERDSFDQDAAHFCSFNASDELVGYVRLVPSNAAGCFPFQEHCRAFSDVGLPPAEESAEISRLMVRSDYRRRRGDLLEGVEAQEQMSSSEDRRQHAPEILLNLYRQMYAHSLATGTRYWYAAMERPLARALARMHFSFRQIGPLMDYYGPVAVYMADLRELESRVGANNPALLAWMRQPKIHRVQRR